MIEKKLIWLVSFPKSGANWTSDILNFGNDPLNYHPKDRRKELPYLELDKITEHVGNKEKPIIRSEQPFNKRYLRNIVIQDNNLIPFKVVYVVRNPLDLVCSMVNHDNLMRRNATIPAYVDKFVKQNYWKYAWAKHVESWLGQSSLPIQIVKYENLLNHTHREIENIYSFCEFNFNSSIIDTAVEKFEFSKVKQEQEKYLKKGVCFDGSPISPKAIEKGLRFMNRGTSGWYKEVLTHDQIVRIQNAYKPTMEKMGYSVNL